MKNSEIHPIGGEPNPLWSAVVFLFLTVFSFLLIGPAIGMALSFPFYDGSLQGFITDFQQPMAKPEMRPLLLLTQGVTTLVGLILTPYVYLRMKYGVHFSAMSFRKQVSPRAYLYVAGIMLAGMVVNSLFIEWNAGLDFSGTEMGDWMRAAEDRAADMTKYMTTFESTGSFLLGLLVIAVIPAIGEEIVFRGFIQRQLAAGLGQPHLAIWISAILFSAIHLQFFGFVPRMLLGALFGYLYYWSGNITIPITAHFVNNASQVVVLYLVQRGVLDMDVESTEAYPVWQVLTFAGILVILLIIFRKLFPDIAAQDHAELDEGV